MSDLTNVLHWLRPSNWAGVECGRAAQTLDVITELQAENARLRERCHELINLCDNRLQQRWDDNTEYRAEIERLREALRQIITHQSLLTELADQTGASIIAREALGEDDEQT